MGQSTERWLACTRRTPSLSSLPKPAQGSFASEVARLLADPTTSFWLADALKGLESRDPVDALFDSVTPCVHGFLSRLLKKLGRNPVHARLPILFRL